MAEYVFVNIGKEWDLAFPFKDVAKVHHSLEEIFPQLQADAVNLMKLFGANIRSGSPLVVLTTNNGSHFLGMDSYIHNQSEEVKLFPMHPGLFQKGKAWARAVLVAKGRISFAVNADILKELQDG